jgi:hypothetical protein
MPDKRSDKKRGKDFHKMPSFEEMKAFEESCRNDFFAGLNQQEIKYENYPAKSPTCYSDQSVLVGAFLARTRALKKHIPRHPEIRPAVIVPGICPLYIMAAENRATDIGPYNAIGTGFVIKEPNHIGLVSPLDLIPGFELIRQMAIKRKRHDFVWRIADDSYISYKLGYEFFGMPKFRCDVYWEEKEDHILCSAVDDGELIMRLRARKIRTRTFENPVPQYSRAYFMRDRIPMTEEVISQAGKMGASVKAGDLVLELGERHPMAEELREVLVSTRPLLYLYMEDSRSIIYEPGRWAEDVLFQLMDLHHQGKEGDKTRQRAQKA